MLPLITPGSQMTNDDSDNDRFLSFAKRSRTVWRSSEPENSFPPAPFWRPYPPAHDPSGLSGRPVVHCFPQDSLATGDYAGASAGRAGCAVSPKPLPGQRRPLAPEKLPTPRELMGQRRRGGRREGVGGSTEGEGAQDKAAAVLHHIRDLKKRQSAIDKLKTDKWWSSTNCKTSQEDSWGPVEGCLLPPGDQINTAGWRNSPSPILFAQGSHDREVTQERNLVPGGNPMMSFVMATADREARDDHNIPFWRRKDFGATWYNIEQ